MLKPYTCCYRIGTFTNTGYTVWADNEETAKKVLMLKFPLARVYSVKEMVQEFTPQVIYVDFKARKKIKVA